MIRPSGPRRPLQSHRGMRRGGARGLCSSESLSLSRPLRFVFFSSFVYHTIIITPMFSFYHHTHTPSISFMHSSHTLHCLIPRLHCLVLAPHNETMKGSRDHRGIDRSRRRSLLASTRGPSHTEISLGRAWWRCLVPNKSFLTKRSRFKKKKKGIGVCNSSCGLYGI